MEINIILIFCMLMYEEANLHAFKASFRRYFNVYIAVSAQESEKILVENEIHVLITDPKNAGNYRKPNYWRMRLKNTPHKPG